MQSSSPAISDVEEFGSGVLFTLRNTTVDAVGSAVKFIFNKRGYSLLNGTMVAGTYGSGDPLLWFTSLGGANRQKFDVEVFDDQGAVRLRVKKGLGVFETFAAGAGGSVKTNEELLAFFTELTQLPELLTPKGKCPFCEGAVSVTARKCRHCGEWLEPQNAGPNQ